MNKLKLFCLCLCLIITFYTDCLTAVTVELPMTNECVYVDNARNVHTGLTENWQSVKLRMFNLSVTAPAYTNTAFMLHFGIDNVISNGLLETSETSVVFAWNSNRWEIRPRGLKELFSAAPASTNAGEKTLFVRMRVDAGGDVSEIEFRDGGPGGSELTFTGLDLSGGTPDYFRPRNWDTLRWTTRGFEDDAQATVKFVGIGATLILN